MQKSSLISSAHTQNLCGTTHTTMYAVGTSTVYICSQVVELEGHLNSGPIFHQHVISRNGNFGSIILLTKFRERERSASSVGS